MTGGGICTETGEWSPSFPGQRAPFPPGNTAALRSGVTSPRVPGPRTDQLVAETLADPAMPPWISHPLLAGTLRAYCRAMAQEQLIGEHSDEPPWASELWYRAITLQETLARKLGLSPTDWLSAPPDATWRQAAA